jgi:hypothetical protein
MDPNANLQEQERILAERKRTGMTRADSGRLLELRQALVQWFHAGGFRPDWSAAPLASKYWHHWRNN